MKVISKKVIRECKKSLGIFVVFFTISLFITVVSFYIVSFRQDIIKSNECLSSKFIMVNFQNASRLDKETFMNTIESENGIILYKNFAYFDKDNSNSIVRGNGIYFNENYFNSVPIYEGRFFGVEDAKSNTPMIVLGKNLLSKTITKNNERYFLYDEIYYRVIGTLGYRNQSSMYDELFIINLKAYVHNSDFNKSLIGYWKIDNIGGNPQKSLDNIYNKLKAMDKGIQVSIVNESVDYNPLKDTLNKSKNIIIITIILIAVLFINIINITQFWVKGKQKEIGIRKAFGGTNRNIILRIIFEYQLISIFAAILAVLSVFLLKHYPKVLILIEQSNFNRDTYIQSVLFMIIFSLILGTVTALIPVKQVLKMEANDIIRGRLK